MKLVTKNQAIELVVVGKHSRKFARATVEQLNADDTYYLCSSNEQCLDELFKLRRLNEKRRDNWRIGITGTFPPIHKKYDFVFLEKSMDCPEVRSMIKCPIMN
jgi:hypothetical protein